MLGAGPRSRTEQQDAEARNGVAGELPIHFPALNRRLGEGLGLILLVHGEENQDSVVKAAPGSWFKTSGFRVKCKPDNGDGYTATTHRIAVAQIKNGGSATIAAGLAM